MYVYFTIYAWLSYVLCLLAQNDATCRWLEIIAETCTFVCLCMDNCNLFVIKLFIQHPCSTFRPSISVIWNSVLHLKADFRQYEFSCFVSVLLDKLLDNSLLFSMGVKFCIYISPRPGWHCVRETPVSNEFIVQPTDGRWLNDDCQEKLRVLAGKPVLVPLFPQKSPLELPWGEARFQRREADH